jgi:ribokinase
LNEEEGTYFSQETDPIKTVQKLVTSNPAMKVVLTLGKDGVVYHDNDSTYTQDIFPVAVVDTTAAGDTFAGYFLASVANGKSIQESLRISSKAASIAVSRKGASDSIPLIDEID